jgi:hypothetical protein
MYCFGTNDEGWRIFKKFNCKLGLGAHQLRNISTHPEAYFAFVEEAMIQSIHIDGTVNLLLGDRMTTVSKKVMHKTITRVRFYCFY